MSEGTYSVYRNDAGELRLRADTGEGERAANVHVADPKALIKQIADAAGLTVTFIDES